MNCVFETYEWDNTWIEKTDNLDAKRVLYIGDSISVGTRTKANLLAKGEILFDGFGTSKALDNPYYFESVRLFAKQQSKVDAVLFNNGLHGWHLNEAEYCRLYNEFLNNLISEFPSVPVILILTTYSLNEDFFPERIIERNKIAKKIASERGLKTIDLYSVTQKNSNYLVDDKVHFTDKGYEEIAKTVISKLGEYLW